MTKPALLILAALPLLSTAACVRTVASVVTAPVRATAQVVDWTTTSRSEADRNYGRRMRKAEEREGRERRAWARRCDGHPELDGCDAYHGFVASSVR